MTNSVDVESYMGLEWEPVRQSPIPNRKETARVVGMMEFHGEFPGVDQFLLETTFTIQISETETATEKIRTVITVDQFIGSYRPTWLDA